ncbi:MAG TPA: 6-carboxytetrahydropterin synthase [Acidobacteriaceae bacterium]|jgi:6-pyruvoyltetrahydropterin/6-carboxytetrahydropterin synthase|nr:6-carboxytetrahydropterin synthase [Acidobacteriaceae bacterium]
MKAYLGRRYRFSASHRLHSDAFNAQQNREIYGKCNNPHGHGHNYTLDVLLSGQVNGYGMVCDLAELDEFAQREVVQRFDVTNLNFDRAFENVVPTTENLCREIFRIFSTGFSAARLERIRVEETQNNFFEYME